MIAALLSDIRKGSEVAETKLVRLYSKPLLSAIRRRGVGPTDAHDVLQNVWCKALPAIRRGSVDVAASFNCWLMTVMRNECIRWQMKWRSKNIESLQEGSASSSSVAHHDRIDQLRLVNCVFRALQGADPQSRDVFLMAFGGHSHNEIAQALGISKHKVANTITRTKALLRTKLELHRLIGD